MKEFSFFFQVHPSYSHIDYFFIDSTIISSTEYHTIAPSNHTPLSIDVQLQVRPQYSSPWRVNPLLFADNKCIEFMLTSIDNFIDTNEPSSTSYSLLWETLKAYLQGQIFSYSAFSCKIKMKELLSNLEYSQYRPAICRESVS